MKIIFCVALVLAAIALPTPARASPAPPSPLSTRLRGKWPEDAASNEAAFVADINSLRASRGLPALKVSANLVRKARTWAVAMAAAREIWHSTIRLGIRANWQKLGENVGMGGSEATLHAAFVASPRHFENLVDPAFGYVGIGVVDTGAVVFVSEVFMQLAPTPLRTTTQAPHRLKPEKAPSILPSSTPQLGKPPLLSRLECDLKLWIGHLFGPLLRSVELDKHR